MVRRNTPPHTNDSTPKPKLHDCFPLPPDSYRFTNHQKPLAILRQKTKDILGTAKELLKSGATRFGTHTIVGRRLQELKGPLQSTVVDNEYTRENYADKADEAEHSNAEIKIRQHKGGTARKLVLDDGDGGFWDRVAQHVSATTPMYNMLRRHDTSAPTVGKVFYDWFSIGESLKESKAPYADKAMEKHEQRWDYGDVPFFKAAYVVDPEFHDHDQAHDPEIMEGFMDTVEKIALLLEVRKEKDKYQADWQARKQMIAKDPAAQKTWDNHPKYPTASSPNVKEFCANVYSQLALYRAKKGIFARPWVFQAAQHMPAYLWWDQYGASTPQLQIVACFILAQPASASLCERINSEFGFIKDR